MPAKRVQIIRKDILYPELSYKIVGILFDVSNELGYQYQERYYQRAIREDLKRSGISFREQVVQPLVYKSKSIGRYYFDFVIDDKVVLEIKRGDAFSPRDIRQIVAYLESSGLKLGLLARFSSKGLKYKRIIKVGNS